MKKESIEQINYLKVPIAKVYDALTSEKGLENVWTKKLKVKPEIGFINEFDFDEEYTTKMKIIELVENKKILWECVASDEDSSGTKSSFALTEKENISTVIL